MIKGWKKLTKEQIKHLCKRGCNSTASFQYVIDQQAKMKAEFERKYPDGPDGTTCWECRQIAKVLGMKPAKGEL